MNEKKALLVVSFGTTYRETLEKTIGAIEQDLRHAFPEHIFFRAFTSPTIRRVLRERDGIVIDSAEEALSRIAEAGYREVLVQPTHIIRGIEFGRLKETADGFRDRFDRLVFGDALLSSDEDYRSVARALADALQPFRAESVHAAPKAHGTDIVLMGHGTEHAANESYERLQREFFAQGMDDMLVGTVEASPTLKHMIELVEKRKSRKVVLTPLLVVAGDHANHDMAGNDPDSWKSKFAAKGCEVQCEIRGIGEYAAIRNLYVEHARQAEKNPLSVVGIGPGKPLQMTEQARQVLAQSDVIVGYTVYTQLLKDAFAEKEFLTTPMTKETERCRMAFAEAQKGRRTAVVCSGDAGVYGMAGLMLELAPEYTGCKVQVIPGVTAALSGGAVLGAPLMHDFAVISLSDLMTPWEKIEKRLRLAAAADFVICIYNPSSRKRADYLKRACDILLTELPPERVCGVVRNIGRDGEAAQCMNLAELRVYAADMFTTVYIGNSQTKIVGGRMVTPRGYQGVGI